MGYAEWSNNKKKKKDNNASNKKASSYAEWSNAKHGITEDEEDIAPVKKTTESEKKYGGGGRKIEDNDVWFKGGAFSDGFDGLSDIKDTFFDTMADGGLGVVKGVGRMAEGLVDLGIYGVGYGADALGFDNFADKAKDAAIYSATDEWTKGLKKEFDDSSLIGNKGDMITEGLGQVATTILTAGTLGAAGVGSNAITAITTGAQGLSTMGTNIGEAYKDGATDGKAFLYGLGTGAIEAATELLSGGLGKSVKALGISRGIGELDDIFAKKLSSKLVKSISNESVQKVLGNTVETAVKSGGEALEEVLSGLGSAFMKWLTYEDDKTLIQLIKDENLLEQAIVGFAVANFAQGKDFIKANKSKTDYVTGHTANEEKVIETVVEKEIAEREANGEKLTSKEKSKIYDNVVESVQNGSLGIEVIEEALGGERYEAYKKATDENTALKKERDELNKIKTMELTGEQSDRLAELKGMNLDDTTNLDELGKKWKDDVYNRLSSDRKGKGSLLLESYRERARRGQAFEADLSQYEGKKREAVERAIKSGVLNNTNRSHELVDILSKIEADKGIIFDYTNNAKLKESGFAVDGKTVNGFVKDGNITLNMQSSKAWESTVGHEITHVLEGTKVYSELQTSLFEYAKSKGEFDTRKADIMKLYEKVENADIDGELTAELVSDYLFNDKSFINHLTGNRTVFQKVWDEVKYLYKVATGKEKASIEKVMKEFDRAWKEMGKGVKSEGTKYSVSDSNGTSLTAEQQSKFENSKVRDAEGRLIPLYHGSRSEAFSVFDMEKGVWLAEDQRYSEVYAGQWHSWRDDAPELADRRTDLNGLEPELYTDPDYRVYKVYADIQNPLDIGEIDGYLSDGKVGALARALGVRYSELKAISDNYMEEPTYMLTRSEEFIELARSKGFDGFKATENGKNTWCAIQSAEQVKLTTNEKPTSDADVRYSLSSISNTFFGDEGMSSMAFEKGNYKQTEGYKNYVDQCVNNMRQTRADFDEVVARGEIEEQIDGIVRVALASKKAGYDIYDDATKRSKTDSKNRLLFSSLEPNSDYFTSSDISTICDKRKNFAEIYDEIVRTEEAKGVPQGKRFFDNVDNYFALHKIMADKGLTQPCRQCYVESMRKNLAPMANAFLKLVNETDANNKANDQLYEQKGKNKGNLKSNNAELREKVLETFAEHPEYGMSASDLTVETLTTEDGLAQLKIQAPLIYEAFNSFYGQSKPKMPKEATPFRFGELTALLTDHNGKIKQSLVDKINSTGGFRLQSYSDFQIQNFTDVLQVIFEAGTLGLNGHAYTKVPAFLDATEGTNLKRNISIFMYKDRNEWKLDKNDSFPYDLEEIYEIVKADKSGNTSIIAVSQNKDMSCWIMANDLVGYGIPFHKSGLKMGTVRDTDVKTDDGRIVKGYSGTIDHTKQQTEVWARATAEHKALTKVKKGINIYSFWDFENKANLSKNELIEKNVKAYIDACEEAGYLPKFRDYVMNNGTVLNDVLKYSKELGFASQDATIDDISFKYKGYTIPYGYYKFLGDFGMFAPDGTASPQETLSLSNYDFDKAENFFADAEALNRNEILQQFSNGEEREKYRNSNLSAEELAEIVNRKRKEVAESVVAPVKNSLSNNGEQPSTKGTPLRDLYLEQDIAPIREDVAKNATATSEAPMLENIPVLPDSELEQGTIAAIRPKPEKQPSMKKKVDVTESEEHVAQVLTEEPKVEKKKKSIFSTAVRNFIDKGAVFENLSLKTKNRALQDTYKTMGRSETKAQYFMENGKDGVKPLNSIIEEVEQTGKTQQFYEYLYHKHNIDRMSLESKELPNLERLTAEMNELKLLNLQENQLRAIASEKPTDAKRAKLVNTVREYLASKDVKNKPVFDYSVTAEMSQETARQLEKANPEFKEYAQDVYDYMNYLRRMLVYNGVISPETAELWAKMYPNYVPIRRADHNGLAVDVPLDTRKTGINAPIKRATGGNSDILPLFGTMAQRTIQTFKAIDKNRFGVELMNTLGGVVESTKTSLDEAIDSIDTHENLLQEGKNGQNPTFTVFEGGERVTFEITDEMYDALKPTSEGLLYTNKVLNTASNLHRGVLTEYNPVFMANNAIKDTQDVLINSQHPLETYANYPEAIKELTTQGQWYTEYMENGGGDNTYFDKQTNTFTEENSGLKKVIGFPFEKISEANNFIEKVPRLAEYIASRKKGVSIEGAMLDAARVTTDFSAGGDVTKFFNRNGATFLNASVQGFAQQVRNVREAKMNGLKGWMGLATKYALAGLPALLLNNLLWDDDEEYEELSDYVKDNYYVVAKYGDGKFVRIPKGRTLAVIQNAFEQVSNALTGNDGVDFNRFFDLARSNLAPNNPIDNNIIAPIIQAKTNKTWFGEDLVPTRLQDVPKAEQYDESTDAISKWLGEKINVSPYKINYLLNQYSGGIGDVFLPMMTPKAERGNNSFVGNMIAPLADKFTTDGVMNNKNVSDFYDTSDELKVNANSSYATDEDILKSKYMSSVNAEMSDLYKQKREIQNSNLSDAEKYNKVREIQKQINALAKDSLNSYEDVDVQEKYGTVGDRHYRMNKGTWEKITDKQLEEQRKVTKDIDIAPTEYWEYKEGLSGLKTNAEKADYVNNLDMETWQKNYLMNNDILDRKEDVDMTNYDEYADFEEFDYAQKNPEKYAVSKAVGGYDAYIKYSDDLKEIEGEKDANGKTKRGTEKANRRNYIFSLKGLDDGQKAILYRSLYDSADDKAEFDEDIVYYINSRNDLTDEEKVTIYTELGFTVKDGYVYW